MSVNKNFDFFLEADLSRYSGQWIAISGNRVIASDFNSEAVIEKVNELCKEKTEIPLFAKVPEQDQVLIL